MYNVVEEMLGVKKSNGLREKSRSVLQRVRQRPDSAITTNFESNGHGKLRRHKSRSLDGGLDQVEGKYRKVSKVDLFSGCGMVGVLVGCLGT